MPVGGSSVSRVLLLGKEPGGSPGVAIILTQSYIACLFAMNGKRGLKGLCK